MKSTNINEKYEQSTVNLEDDFAPAKIIEEEKDDPKKKKSRTKEFEVGAEVIVNPETKRFCDGRGIPDYARKAYIKKINSATKTIVIETKPNGKELGVLFISDVTIE